MQFRKISNEYPLVLASASPRRKVLLEQIKIPFSILSVDIDENNVKGRPYQICRRLAEKKALEAYNRSKKGWILGADTIVVQGDTVMGKPLDREEAFRMLEYLSNNRHKVITGLSIINPSGSIAITDHVSTTVSVKNLSHDEIEAYIRTGEPFGKAGGYGIQGIGSFMIREIKGSYSNVVGLPLHVLVKSLVGIKAIGRYPASFERS